MSYSDYAQEMAARRQELVSRCTACGDCLQLCPVFAAMKFHHLGAPQLTEMVLELLEGGPVVAAVYDTVWSCMGCIQCNQWCPQGIAPSALFSLARIETVSRGQAPPPLTCQLHPRHPYNFGSVFSALQLKPESRRWFHWAPENPRPVDVVLWLGCYIMGLPNTVFTLLDILEMMGINFVALGGNDLCCGIPYSLLDQGPEQSFVAAEELMANIMAFRPKTVVTGCHSCWVRFTFQMPQYMDVPVRFQHYPEFLTQNLNKLSLTHSINKVVTYQDHCSMRRAGVGYEVPRQLLQAIPGITLVEMAHNRENALCCGGLNMFTNLGVSRRLREVRLEEAQATGAELLVNTCSGCYSVFAGLERGYPFTITQDILLLGEALGIKYENRFKQYLYRDDVDAIITEAEDNIEANNLDPDRMKQVLPVYLAGLRRQP